MATALTEGTKVQNWINLVLGACAFLSPWVVGFAGETMAAWNAWIVGVLIAIVAIAALSAFAEWEEWVSLVLGLWLIIAPWVLGFAGSAGPLWTHLVLGVVVAAVSCWALWEYRRRSHATA
jgi:hypothetical protein